MSKINKEFPLGSEKGCLQFKPNSGKWMDKTECKLDRTSRAVFFSVIYSDPQKSSSTEAL